MAEIGACLDKTGIVNAVTVARIGAQWGRFVADRSVQPQQLTYASALQTAGVQRFLTFDMDSYRRFGDPHKRSTWLLAHQHTAEAFGGLVDVVNPFNEPDGTGDESSTMSVSEVNQILAICKAEWPSSVKLVGVGDVTGQGKAYYDQIEIDLLDGIDAHLYAKFPPTHNPGPNFSLERALDHYLTIGKPLYLSEIGISSWLPNGTTGPGYEETQARFLFDTLSYIRARADVVMCCWFCAHPYDGWGLWDQEWRFKPAGERFMELMSGSIVNEGPAFQQGFAKWAALEPFLIGEPVTNEGPVFPGWQRQRSSRGWLNWVDGKGFGFEDDRGRVFRWNDGMPRSEEIT